MNVIAENGGDFMDLLHGGSLIEPNRPVGRGETVIGSANKKAQSIYLEAVRAQSAVHNLKEAIKSLDESYEDLSEDVRQKKLEETERKLYRERLRLNGKVSELFLALSDDHPRIRCEKRVAIRKGWQLVSLPVDDADSPMLSFEILQSSDLFVQA